MFLTKKNSSLNLGITSQKILKFPKKRNVKYNHSEISLYTLQDTYNEKDKKKVKFSYSTNESIYCTSVFCFVLYSKADFIHT